MMPTRASTVPQVARNRLRPPVLLTAFAVLRPLSDGKAPAQGAIGEAAIETFRST